jgi:GNAT superfamily N-acetyltransferase
MTAEDLHVGLRLARQAGWNQTEADWRRLIGLQPDGCFVAELEGRPVATVTACLFGPVAWIAMVLVDEAVRGRGIGRSMVAHALEFLDGRGARTVRLDATSMGLPLYQKLGFVAEYPLARFGSRLRPSGAESGAGPLHSDLMDRLITLDRAVTGTDREKLLRRLAAESPEAVRVVVRGDEVDGFLMARPGARATQVGPCIAGPEAGALLLSEARHTYAGQTVFVDVPADHAAACAQAQAGGLTVQRHLVRMRRGDMIEERPEGIWASSGPEKG